MNNRWDAYEDLSGGALDDAALDALAASPPSFGDDRPGQDHDHDHDTITTLMFAAVNPEQTVGVTVLLDGTVLSVDLTPSRAAFTECELGKEISAITELARLQARAAQHAIVTGIMQNLGHDPIAVRSHLENELGLPSPETVALRRAELFSARHTGNRG